VQRPLTVDVMHGIAGSGMLTAIAFAELRVRTRGSCP
jgi:hypothetical protein